MKQCTRCKMNRTSEEFRKQPANRDGLQSWCKYCQNKGKKEWFEKNRDKANKWRRNRNKIMPERMTGHNLRRNFWPESTWDQANENYKKLLDAQSGKCAICGIEKENYKKSFAVDHCHKTGKIRGLLCCKCNRGIGYANESVDTLTNAIKYLQKHGSDMTEVATVETKSVN